MCCSIDDTAALLTNVEVRCILEQNRSGVGRARGERIDPRAEYIQNQVHLRPLNAEKSECLLTPAAQVVEYIDSSQCKQTTAESIARFIDAVKTFGLTQAEMLQLVNHQPAQEVEIHTVGNSTQCSVASTAHPRALQMVEHCAERFPDEQVRPHTGYRAPYRFSRIGFVSSLRNQSGLFALAILRAHTQVQRLLSIIRETLGGSE